MYSDGVGGNGHKLQQKKFQFFIMNKIFTMTTVRYWKKLLREAVQSQSLSMLRTQLDNTLSKWTCFEHGAGRDELGKVPSNLNYFLIL